MVGGKARLIYENISLQPVPGAHSSKGGILRDRGVGNCIIDYPRNNPRANTGSPESPRFGLRPHSRQSDATMGYTSIRSCNPPRAVLLSCTVRMRIEPEVAADGSGPKTGLAARLDKTR